MNWKTVICIILLVSFTIVRALPRSYRDTGKNISRVFILFFHIILITAMNESMNAYLVLFYHS